MEQTLDREQMKALLDGDEDFVLINVLGRDDFRQAHLPRSINIPVADERFEDHVRAAAGYPDRKIVVYCASFECHASPTAARKLRQAGMDNVWDYEGGVKDWRQGGLPLVGQHTPERADR